MIRKLQEADREMTMEFLGREAAINLFAIGDIEAFGFDSDFQELWGQFDGNNELEGVLLRFNESYIPYLANVSVDHTGFAEIIGKDDRKIMLSGKESVALRFLNEKERENPRSTYFCELKSGDKLLDAGDLDIKVATVQDAERISKMLDQIEEFEGTSNEPGRIAHKLETKTGRIFYLENEQGEIISVSQTTAENSKSAMVVGVATLPEYRGKGIMSKCLSALCKELLSEGRTLCLFYDNPKAGKVYHKLGFESIDNWIMQSREPERP